MLDTMEKFTNNAAINEHESVQMVYDLLHSHNMVKERQDIESLVKHMELLNVQFEKVFQELSDVKGQLEQIQNKDIRKIVSNIVHVVDEKVTEVGEQFLSVKNNFLKSIDNGLTAFKEQGAKAFHNTLDFLKIKSGLAHVKKGLENCAATCHRTSEKTEKMSEEMSVIGGHTKNIGRLFTGKQPIEVSVSHKDTGILQGIKNIFTRAGVRLSRMAKATESTIAKIEQLEKRTAKSSVRQELSAIKNTNSKNEKIKSQERGR